jgi:hypothetical protein
VWRHGTQFRAVLRAVGGEQLHLFHGPGELGEFLGQPRGTAGDGEMAL